MSKILKPFAVKIELTAVVMAEDAAHAIYVAKCHKHDVASDDEGHFLPGIEITSEEQLDLYGWDGMCLPYGGDGHQRLRDILAALEALPDRDTKTIDMFEEQKS
ncbi:hypothetical protein [Caballeronia cordobensis]|uniref:hypothetical protein n=1 Tax=Caballeronia cordobensis TaxID=1353886 RepID=UPI00045EF547|nr:uncharacterized protein BRPE67_BCDS10420 [Burkholderia sp. RPE67]